MNTLIDEMYRIASLIKIATTFTVAYLQEILETPQPPVALYTLIGELLERGLLNVTEQQHLVLRANATLSIDTVKRYRLVEGKRDAFEQYYQELEIKRIRPHQDGKPQGLSYRVLEQLIEDVIEHPETLTEKKALIDEYLAAATEDEMFAPDSSPKQKEVSEAYLRELYGSYLQAKREWQPAVQQYLRASLLFLAHGYNEKKDLLEFRIMKLFWRDDISDNDRKDILTKVEDTIDDQRRKYTTLLQTLSGGKNKELQSDKKEITTDSRQVPQATQDTDTQPPSGQAERDSSTVNSLFNKVPTTSSPTGYSEPASSQKDPDRMNEVLQLAGIAA